MQKQSSTMTQILTIHKCFARKHSIMYGRLSAEIPRHVWPCDLSHLPNLPWTKVKLLNTATKLLDLYDHFFTICSWRICARINALNAWQRSSGCNAAMLHSQISNFLCGNMDKCRYSEHFKFDFINLQPRLLNASFLLCCKSYYFSNETSLAKYIVPGAQDRF